MNNPSKSQVDLFIEHGFIIPVTGADNIIIDGAVAVKQGKIVEVGSSKELAAKYEGLKHIDATGKVVMPGLINGHCHFLQDFMKGAQDDLPLVEWIDKVSFPRIRVAVQDYFDGKPELQYYATLHGCVDSLKSGVTTVLNMEWATPLETIKVYEDTGIRAMHGLTITDNDKWTPPEAILPHAELFDLAERLNERAKNSKDGRVIYWHAIACPNSNSTQMIKDVRAHASEHNIPIHIHLAETNFEFNNIQKLYGNTPTGYLEDIGLLASDVSAAHGIWVTDEDIEILSNHGVSIIHNPECNMKIASGTAPIAKMLGQGMAVGVGSDSVAVKDNHDLFQTMRIAVFLQRVTTLDAMALSSYQALEMATLGGAKALKMGDKLGSLEPGKLADIILVDLNSSQMRPINNLINNVVYCATADRVTDVIVAGKLVVENRKLLTVDEEQALAESEQFAYKRYTAAGLSLPPYFSRGKVGD